MNIYRIVSKIIGLWYTLVGKVIVGADKKPSKVQHWLMKKSKMNYQEGWDDE